MEKVKLTKGELKKQKEELQRFTRYLPTLQLKKQQLRFEISKIDHTVKDISTETDSLIKNVSNWVDVFAEEVNIDQLLKVEGIKTETGNVAGIDIPVFVDVELKEEEYDLLLTPLWVDKALEVCKDIIDLNAKLLVHKKQRNILQEELRITTQRVNLFEKIKIPEAKENIRVINIYLGDLQIAEIVRGKIAKAKLERKNDYYQ